MMGRIYRQASQVLGWLDLHTLSSGGLSMLDDFREASNRAFTARLADKYSAAVVLGEFDSQLQAIVFLLLDDWFCRIWNVQEVTLASNLILMHGHDHMPWDDVLRAVGTLVQLDGFFDSIVGSLRLSLP
jgi:hypothetical protein